MDALQAIAEPRRREILRLVWDEERAAGDIAARMPVTFGAVSQHLAVLREAGCVRVRRDGRRRYYRADRERLAPFRDALTAMWGETLDRLVETIDADRRGRGPAS